MTGAALGDVPARICQTEGCGSVLSRFNSRTICAMCEARLEIGGVRISLPPQPSFPPREIRIDRERPTTDGAVPLPAAPVVVTPERPLEEMLRKPQKPAIAEPTPCAECGHALPPNAQGWLCADCERTAVARRGIVAAAEFDKTKFEEAPPMEPEPEPEPEQVAESEPPASVVACRAQDCDRPATMNVGVRGRFGSLCTEHYQEMRQRQSAAARAQSARAVVAAPITKPILVDPAAEPSRLSELDDELSRLELELDHISGEQTRLYARWRVANSRWHDVIAEMAANARSAA